VGLGDAYRGLEDLDKALEAWTRCLKLRPHDHKTMTRMADCLKKRGDFEASKTYYFMALKKNPCDLYALMGLGQIAVLEKDDETALEYFERVLETSPNSVIALTAAANIHRKRRAFREAIHLYDQALRINPRNSHAWHGKADCLRGRKEYTSAIGAWNRALENGMDRRVGLSRIGDSYIRLKDLSMAETNYKKAMAIGYDKYAFLGISKIHEMRGEPEKALEILNILVRKEPQDQRIYTESRKFVNKYPEMVKTFSVSDDADA